MSINSAKATIPRQLVKSDRSRQAQSDENTSNRAAVLAASVAGAASTHYAKTKKAKWTGNKQFTQVANYLLKNGSKGAEYVLNNIKFFNVAIIGKDGQKVVAVTPKQETMQDLIKANVKNNSNQNDLIFNFVDKSTKKIQIGTDLTETIEANTLKIANTESSRVGNIFTEKMDLDKLKQAKITFKEKGTDGSKKLIAKGAKAAWEFSHIAVCTAGAAVAGLAALGITALLDSDKKPPNVEQD